MYAVRRVQLSSRLTGFGPRCGGPCARRVVLAAVAAVVLYFLLYPRVHHYSISYSVDQTPPKLVWEFVADFSNMPKLNPTILSWELLSEGGNYAKWHYSVRYTEFLSGFPLLKNYATAHFQVEPAKGIGSDYTIVSTHSTCFYSDMLCLPSASEFRFTPEDGGASTSCSEAVRYACPWILGTFCRKEVEFQRQAIRDNLRTEFSAM